MRMNDKWNDMRMNDKWNDMRMNDKWNDMRTNDKWNDNNNKIIWFGDTVTMSHPTKGNTNSKLLALSGAAHCPK